MTTTLLFSSSIQINTGTAFSKNIVAEAKLRSLNSGHEKETPPTAS